jgi:probable HAF family extracellular repeat protein
MLAQPLWAQVANRANPPGTRPAWHPQRILVKPRANAQSTGASLLRVHQANGARVLRAFPSIGGLQVVELPPNSDITRVVEKYRQSGAVAYAEPDYEIRISTTPNDPQYLNGTLWALNNTGQNGGTPGADIAAAAGWSTRNEAPNVIVAVIDTGVRYTHEDLAANMWINPGEIPGNGVDDDGDGYIDDLHGINAITGSGDPMDDNGHGTHVAGIIGAVGNNGVGVVGVAWKVRIMACKFLNSLGSGYTSDAITCIDYARAHGANIMNNSWGSPGDSQALSDAISSARAAGIIFVAAAGNNSANTDLDPFFPADDAVDNIVAVAATTRTDDLAYFSNYGLGSVDIGAPGMDIFSTWFSSDSAYMDLSGTSMAAPEVSGVFALMEAQFPSENYLELMNRVYASVDPLDVLSNKCRTGGRINLANALNSASDSPGNDNFSNRMFLSGANLRVKGINVDATKEPGEPNHAGDPGGKSIWWSWHCPATSVATITTTGSSFNTLLAAYTGASVSNLSLVASNGDNPAGGVTTSSVTFDAAGGTDYEIAVDGAGGDSGSVVLNISSLARPVNDDFTNRIAITGSLSTVTGSNTLATTEAGEPLHAGLPGGHSVWWSWTAPKTQTVEITTAGSDFDTLLAIYTGNSVDALTPVASNDGDPANGTTNNSVTFNAIAEKTYQIAVDGFEGATGDITLNTPPPNDNFADRLTLTGINATGFGFNVLATKEPGEPNHAGNTGGKSLWWTWTAPVSGSVSINTFGSDFDTLLAVYTGSSLDSLVPVAANDNDPYGDSLSLVTINAVAGTTYQIAADGANGASGKVQLAVGNSGYAITEILPPTGFNNTVAYSINDSGMVAGVFETDAPNYTSHACIWTAAGGIQPLFSGDTDSEANDLNNFGVVVGHVRMPGDYDRAFLWQNGIIQYLGALNTAIPWAEAKGIDDLGRVVGFSLTADGTNFHAFLWQEGAMQDLGASPGYRSYAYGINDAGDIVGQDFTVDGSSSFPTLWRNNQMIHLNMPEPYAFGCAIGLNSFSQIVGSYQTAGHIDGYGFLWDNGSVTNTGNDQYNDASGNSINDLGQIVGANANWQAMVWQNTKWTTLTNLLPATSGWSNIFSADKINDHGQIVAAGLQNDGYTRGLVLTPLTPPAPMPVITSPTNQQGFFAPTDIPFAVTLLPDTANLDHVDYLQGSAIVATSSKAPFSGTWHCTAPGQYTLTAQAVTGGGAVAVSKPVAITVMARPVIGLTTSHGQFALTWPTSSVGFTLEWATNLATPIQWHSVTDPVSLVNGSNQVSVIATNDCRFFQLISIP